MKHSLEYMSKSALRKMRRIAVDNLRYSELQIRKAKKNNDAEWLRFNLACRKEYKRDIALVDELQRGRGVLI